MVLFEFDNTFFEGLCFKGSNKYTEEFFDNLLNNPTHYSKMKYWDAMKDEINEEIHIKLSYSFVFKVLSTVGLIISLILGIKLLLLLGLVFLIFSFVCQLLFNYLKIRTYELQIGKNMSREIVELIFNQEIN
jgi:hypothetical protein